MAEDRMLSDEVLLALIKKNSGGGGGGTNNYNQLENKPQIAGVTLQGNKSLSDLGIASATALGSVSDAVTAITNGTDIDSFADVETALAGKQGTLTAGDYISINASNEISVNRELTPHQTSYRIKGTGRDTMNITKYIDGVQESSTDYTYSQGTTRTIDDAFTINDTYSSAGYIWQFVWLKDSITHDKDYIVEYRSYEGAFDFTEVFNDEDLSGYKLVIKSELDTAISGKQDTLTFDDAPTDNSNNPVKSNGIYDALELKQNATDNSLQTTDKTIVGAINEHEGDIGSLKSGLTNLDNEVNGDATTYPYADVITVSDAVPANLADCNVKIEPVQDLHGYDKPWVGGAGKNKLPMTVDSIKALNTTGTWSGNAYTVNNVTFTILTDDANNVIGVNVNGTAGANVGFKLFQTDSVSAFDGMVLNGCPNDGSLSKYRIAAAGYNGGTFVKDYNNLGSDVTLTLTADNIDSFYVSITAFQGYNIQNVKFYPMIRLSTETDATFAPYTNICPITGHTEVDVTVERPNLLVDADWVDNKYITQDGSIGNMEGMYRYTNNYIGVSGNTLYAIHEHQNVATNLAMAVAYYDSDKTFIRRDIVVETSGVSDYTAQFTTPVNCRYVRANVALQSDDVMMQEGVFGHKTYTIAIGDTIYGGTVDFDSGVMTVTHQYVTKNTSTMNNLEQYPGWTGAGIRQIVGAGIDGVISTCVNVSDVIRANTLTVNDILFFEKNDIGLTQTELIALAIDVAFVVELATPTTIQLTPQQIQLLKGTNTFTASTGQISVTVNGVSGAIGALTEDVAGLQSGLDEQSTSHVVLSIPANTYNTREAALTAMYTTYNALSSDKKRRAYIIWGDTVYRNGYMPNGYFSAIFPRWDDGSSAWISQIIIIDLEHANMLSSLLGASGTTTTNLKANAQDVDVSLCY